MPRTSAPVQSLEIVDGQLALVDNRSTN